MAKPSQILICIPVLLMGGTEVQTLNIVKALVSGGHHVMVCCYYEYEEVMVSIFRSANAEVRLLNLKRSDGFLNLIIKLRRIIKLLQPNIVHIQYVAPGLIPIITAKISGARTVIATVHQPGSSYGWKAKLLLRIGALLCSAFFCVSRSAEESWFGDSEVFNPQYVNHKRKHFTIYNAVNVSRFTNAVNSIDLDQLKTSLGLDGYHVIGIVGRLRKEKGQEVLLSAMEEVVKNIPDTKLLVVGNGPDRDQLIKKSEELGISNHVLWLGLKEPEETLQLYGIMDVVAVPSLFEGFGLTAAEAMAAGRPVIASYVDGLKEVIKDGATGYLIPVGDSKALAKRLVELLSNPSKAQALGKAGSLRVAQHFSQEQFTESTLAAYQYFS